MRVLQALHEALQLEKAHSAEMGQVFEEAGQARGVRASLEGVSPAQVGLDHCRLASERAPRRVGSGARERARRRRRHLPQRATQETSSPSTLGAFPLISVKNKDLEINYIAMTSKTT